MCAISRAISYAKNSLWCSYVCTFPCVRYRARVISRTRFSRSKSEFLVRDFTRARDVLTTRMLVILALPVKTKDGQQGAGNFTCASSPKTKGLSESNAISRCTYSSCSYINFTPHNFLSDLVAVDSVHGHASWLWQEPGNPTRGMLWRQGIPGRIPLNTCCRSWKCIFSYAILRSHGNVFSRTRYRALELARDIAHMENGPKITWPVGLWEQLAAVVCEER